MKSIYGSRKTAAKKTAVAACVEQCPNIRGSFLALSQLIYDVERTFPLNYSTDGVISEFVAQMGARAYVSPLVFVRLVWRQENYGVVFDQNNRMQRLQIKDIYIRYKYNYLMDRLFQDAIGLTLIS
jgi:hypothetical protein